ncbi:hypothetical protein N9933_03035 [bacterium]|nr:hypothetical protein [bacterium]
MTKKDKLFELVDSMTMSEKRYFKVFAGRHTIGKQNNYIILFNEVEKMRIYDQDKLQNRLERQDISPKHLSSDKNYLYNLVLRSLSSFHSGKSVGLQIKEILHQAEVLYDRGLHEHCLKILHKAKSLTGGNNQNPLLPEIEKWEYLARSAQADTGAQYKSLKNSLTTLNLLKNENTYLLILQELREYNPQKRQVRTQEMEENLDKIMSASLLSSEKNAGSFLAKLIHWRIHALYHFIKDETQKSMIAAQKAIDLIQSQKKYLTEYAVEYANARFQMLLLSRNQPDETFHSMLFEFRSIPDKLTKAHPRTKAIIYTNSYFAEMSRLTDQKRFEEAFDLLPAMESMFDTFHEDMTQEMKLAYHYFFSYTNLVNGQAKRALASSNTILNEFESLSESHFYTRAQLLNLAIHYALGNNKYLKYVCESTLRTLNRENSLFKIEDFFIKSMKKLSIKSSPNDRQALLKKCLHGLNEIGTDRYESRAFIAFNIQVWLELRILDVPPRIPSHPHL